MGIFCIFVTYLQRDKKSDEEQIICLFKCFKIMENNNDRQLTGALGESLVITELIKNGWVAVNANTSVRNHKSIDIICVKCDEDTYKHKSALVQVKTRRGKDFPTGFNLYQSANLEFLEKEVKGPYVFVHIDNDNNPNFYVLSRSHFIKLLYELHIRYNNIPRQRPLNDKMPAELHLSLLQGNDGKSSKGIEGFKNPFPGNIFHNAWGNIWKE